VPGAVPELIAATSSIPAHASRVTAVLPSDVTAEQQPGDAFPEAGQITKGVDISSTVDNILPAGFDSSKDY
jgi:sulfonate transport system substrate-binding protein